MAPRKYQLVSIPASHYVEKARWAMDIAGVEYVEHMYPPMIHYLKLLLLGIRSRTVPAVVTPEGKKLTDSHDILVHVSEAHPDKAGHLYPPKLSTEVMELETKLNRTLGVVARVVAYWHLFDTGASAIIRALCFIPGISWWARLLFILWYWPLMTILKTGLRINKVNKDKALFKVKSIFKEMSDLLSDGRPFLIKGPTQPTAADITFAALSAILIQPQNYGGKLNIRIPEGRTHEWRETLCDLRQTPAGRHALMMYKKYRVPATPASVLDDLKQEKVQKSSSSSAKNAGSKL